MLDHIFRGMIKTHTQSEDLHVNEEMTNKMFMDSKFGFGLGMILNKMSVSTIFGRKQKLANLFIEKILFNRLRYWFGSFSEFC